MTNSKLVEKENKMTNSKLVEMVFVIDESGSMWNLAKDTIGGFNTVLKDQKEADKENGTTTKVTTVLFDNKPHFIHEGIDLNEVEELNEKSYSPNGGTALLDALGKAILSVGRRLRDMDESNRPGKVMVTVITDGEENSSFEFRNEQIKNMIKHQEEKYSWIFNFIGANQDSFSVASHLGFNRYNTANYEANTVGTASVYSAVSKRLLCAKRSVDFSVGASLQEQVDNETSND